MRPVSLLSALWLVCVSAAPCTASDYVRFFGRDFPRAGSPAMRARAARLATQRVEFARWRAERPALTASDRGGPSLMGWIGDGVTVTGVPTPQVFPAATADGSGGAVIAWVDYRVGSGDIYAMRLTSDGDRSVGWPVGGLAATASDSIEVDPRAVSDGAGGAFIAFGRLTATTYGTISLQRVTGTGTLSSGWPANGIVFAPPGSQGFDLIPSTGNAAILGWMDEAGQIRVVRVSGTGALSPGWPAAGLTIGSSGLSLNSVSGVADGSGGVYLAWVESDGVLITRVTSGGTFAAGFSSAGLPLVAGTAGGGVELALLSNGDVMGFWDDFRSLVDIDIYAQRVTAAGALGWTVDGVPVCTSAGSQRLQGAVGDASGGAIASFDAAGGPIFAQRMTSAGATAGGWPSAGLQMCTPGTSFLKQATALVADGSDGALIAWSETNGSNDDVFAQRADAGGSIFAGWPAAGAVISDAAGDQTNAAAVTDNAGGLIVAWEDTRNPVLPQIYAGHVQTDATVPALASLVEAISEPGSVRLRWHSPDGAAFSANLERAEDDRDYVTLARVNADGGGHVLYEDRDVTAGRTYRYRLAVVEEGRTRYLGAVTVRVPSGARLAIDGFRPNPAAGELNLAFALPRRETARIEIFDLAGRRVLDREVAPAEPGERVLSLRDARLGDGVYLLRLSQGTQSVTARGVVLR